MTPNSIAVRNATMILADLPSPTVAEEYEGIVRSTLYVPLPLVSLWPDLVAHFGHEAAAQRFVACRLRARLDEEVN